MRTQSNRNPITLALTAGLALSIPASLIYIIYLLLGDMTGTDKVFFRGAAFTLFAFLSVVLILSLFLSVFVRATLRNQIDLDELRAGRYNASKVMTHHHYPQELPAGEYSTLPYGGTDYPLSFSEPVHNEQINTPGDIVLQ